MVDLVIKYFGGFRFCLIDNNIEIWLWLIISGTFMSMCVTAKVSKSNSHDPQPPTSTHDLLSIAYANSKSFDFERNSFEKPSVAAGFPQEMFQISAPSLKLSLSFSSMTLSKISSHFLDSTLSHVSEQSLLVLNHQIA